MVEYQYEEYYLAKVVNSQESPNKTQLITWENTDNALTRTYDTYATSQFTAKYNSKTKKTVYNMPWTLTAHDFDLNLPSNAYVKEIQFIAHIKADDGLHTIRPTAQFNLYGGAFTSGYSNVKKGNDGWYNGTYYRYPIREIPSQWLGHTYTIHEEDLVKGKFKVSNFNSPRMGIDLIFNNPTNKVSKDTTWTVYCAYVEIRVRYDLPKYNITYKALTSDEDAKVNSPYKVRCSFNNFSKANDGVQAIKVDLPFGNELLEVNPLEGTFNPTTSEWTVDTSKGADLELTLLPKVSGDNVLTLSNNKVGIFPHEFFVNRDTSGIGASGIELSTSPNPHKLHRMCVFVDIIGQSETEQAVYRFNNDKQYVNGEWSFDEGSLGVTVDSIDGNQITLNVPQYEDYSCKLRFCLNPSLTGENTSTVSYVVDNEPISSSSITFDVDSPYIYKIGDEISEEPNVAYLHGESLKITNHRVISDIDFNSFYLPSTVNEGDSLMTQSECGLKMYAQKELDYIGCVPLEHLHFDPKSTFKDTLINTNYKNKRYMGKKLATDEDISLNVRLHPHQVTTIQGLISMDKPIPINANHKCFEGDALNHRGWAEIYSIKAEETNPHWYKCDIDVKYLTHNLNTRFYIEKGVKVSTYEYPSLMAESVKSGTSLEDGYFTVDTDGTFYYNNDEEAEDISRNILSINSGQYFNIKSSEILPNQSSISFNWLSTLVEEERENNIRRIVRLIDTTTNNPIFEYEYADIEYDDETIMCSTISRLWDGVGWDTSMDSDVSLWLDKSILDDDEIDDELNQTLYGTNLHFNIENNKLNIIDEGFNGREVTRNFELKGSGKYIYEVDVKNTNIDAETDAVDFYVDLTVMDTILTSDYAEKYGKLYVSPFPVAEKEVVFTRQGDEGTIYYLEDDGEEFSYIINPSYQYKNGTDLVTSDGISIFSLNYGYEVVYIQNGLVRLGFNRLNGRIYLGKYDPQSRQYFNLYRFHLKKYDDININSISDDKIEIQASDTIFTIYRGHPYIVVNHPTEDIWLDTSIGTVWAERVGGDYPTELPSYWDLMNNSNLLQEDVGGTKGLKTSNVEISEVEVSDKENTTLSIVDIYDGTTHYSDFSDVNFEINTDYIFTLSGEMSTIAEYIPTDYQTYNGEFGQYTFSIENNNTVPFDLRLYSTLGGLLKSTDVSELQASLTNADGDGLANQTIKFYEIYNYNSLTLYVPILFQDDDAVSFKALLKDDDGSRISDETIRFYDDDVKSVEYTPSGAVTHTGTVDDYCYSLGLDDIGLDLHSDDFILEFDYNSTNVGGRLCLGAKDKWATGKRAGQYYIFMGYDGSGKLSYGIRTTQTNVSSLNDSATLSNTYHFKMVKQGHTITYYIDGVQIGTKSEDWFTNYRDYSIYIQVWRASTITISNLKISDVE